MEDGEDFDGSGTDPINDTIRCLDQLAQVLLAQLRHEATRKGEVLGLAEASHEAFNNLLRVDRGREPDVLGDSAELVDGLLRPTELQPHEARRIRLRMRAMASSCETVLPASASANPNSMACRT